MTEPQPARKAFTIVELLVVVAIIALLIAILLPAVGRARDTALVTQSKANLKNISVAASSYGADWSDRQWTAAPDDAGMYGGTTAATQCAAYIAQVCPQQQIAGYAADGGIWGFWVGGPMCPPGFPGGCGNWTILWPCSWNQGTGGYDGNFGAWRLINYKSFNEYVNGRYYDKIFWAPKDKYNLERAAPGLQYPGDFIAPASVGGTSIRSTYVWGPAAMWATDTLSAELGYRSPLSSPAGFRSPTVGQASFPDLKVRTLEMYWLQNLDGGPMNSAYSPAEPWRFNQGTNSAPVCSFFDGHIALVPMTSAVASDERMKAQQASTTLVEKGLWVRNSPLGVSGWEGATLRVFDQEIAAKPNSMAVLTTDGIGGRDITSAR